jgi:hypothetical protein
MTDALSENYINTRTDVDHIRYIGSERMLKTKKVSPAIHLVLNGEANTIHISQHFGVLISLNIGKN